MRPPEIIITYVTAPDEQTANNLASELVEQRLAACVNVIPGVTSHYRWEGKACTDTELLMIIKTEKSKFSAVRDFILNKHPYDLPEIIAVDITNGFSSYLNWVISETSQQKDK